MGLLGSIITDFLLFSFWESAIFYLFFRRFGNCDKFTLKDITIVGFGNCIISQIIPPLIYQLVMIIWMGLYLKLFKNKTLFKGLYLSLFSMLFLLIVESVGMMIYDNILNINVISNSNLHIFILIIPIKLFEIILIEGGVKMKAWWSEIEKKK